MPIGQWFKETETLYITGERVPGLGPTLQDVTLMDGFIRRNPVVFSASLGVYHGSNTIIAEPAIGAREFGNRMVSLYDSERTVSLGDHPKRPVSTFNHVYRGGLSTVATFITKFGVDQPFTLGDVEDSTANPMDAGRLQLGQKRSIPLAWNYPEAVRTAIEEAERKTPGAFKKVHGYDILDYRSMPFTEVQRIGTSQASKEAGIPALNWKLLLVRGSDAQTLIEGTKVPFVEGYDAFSAYFGPGIINPGRLVYAVTGGRGGSGIAGEAVKEGVSYAQRKFGLGDNDWEFRSIPGINEVVDELDQRITDAARMGAKGFVFAVPTKLRRNFPIIVGKNAMEEAVRVGAIPGNVGESLLEEKTNLLYFGALQAEDAPEF
ncbi:MAG: hypothetical protein HY515_03850 [Candidatus Aenigmarchaeota archaeon]|nr:hypothetical protein [Candidatus Aenigmarchaeota archaeon]